jgi:hypothetical protein
MTADHLLNCAWRSILNNVFSQDLLGILDNPVSEQFSDSTRIRKSGYSRLVSLYLLASFYARGSLSLNGQ